MNKDFEKYINKITADKLENYGDTLCSYDDEVNGTRNKKFVRVSGDVFSELFDELRNNPDCSYETYMNDIIRSGYNPQYLSVLKKDERRDSDFRKKDKYEIGHLADVCASRILNCFECSTAYETMLNIDGELCCCSVDFNNPDEVFYNLCELNGICYLHDPNNLLKYLDDLDHYLEAFKYNKLIKNCKSKKEKNKVLSEYDEQVRRFEEAYIYSWIIRTIVLRDPDYSSYNIGLIHNTKENTFRMAPNFDFEYCFNDIREDVWSSRNINNLQYISSNYPNVYSKFVSKLEQLLSRENGKSKVRKILESVIGSEERAKPFLEDFRKRLRELYNLITEFVPTSENL